MHGQAYFRKGIVPHLHTALEEVLWLASQVPVDRLDTVPAGATGSVRARLLALAVDLDVTIYPPLIALVDGHDPPATLDSATVASRRAGWAAADLMVAMKQIRYRYQA